MIITTNKGRPHLVKHRTVVTWYRYTLVTYYLFDDIFTTNATLRYAFNSWVLVTPRRYMGTTRDVAGSR